MPMQNAGWKPCIGLQVYKDFLLLTIVSLKGCCRSQHMTFILWEFQSNKTLNACDHGHGLTSHSDELILAIIMSKYQRL